MLRRKKLQSDSPTWTYGMAEVQGRLVSLRFDTRYKDPLPGHTTRILLAFRSRSPDETGFASSAERDAFEGLTESFLTASRGSAVLVGVVTGDGSVRYMFYAQDSAWVGAWQRSRREDGEQHQFGVSIEEDPKWGAYRSFLPEARRAAADLRVYQELVARGAQPDRSRRFDWRFYLPDEVRTRAAADQLAAQGLDVSLDPSGDGRWLLVGSQEAPMSLGYIVSMSASAERFARDFSGEFDGWGSALS